jgi:HSP20 family protein
MTNLALTKLKESSSSVFDDFFKPWNEWFDGELSNRAIRMPAVNITEQKDDYQVSLAVPGLKKEDFNIDIDGNLLIVSSKKEDKKEDKEGRYTRREYSYSSFERSFNLPDEVNKEKIEAHYEDGLLKLFLPKKEESKKSVLSKHISVK